MLQGYFGLEFDPTFYYSRLLLLLRVETVLAVFVASTITLVLVRQMSQRDAPVGPPGQLSRPPAGVVGWLSQATGRGFVVPAAVLFVALATLNYWPVLVGKIPLPVDLIVQFPPWDTCCSALRKPVVHAEIGDLVTAFFVWRAFLGHSVWQGILPLWNPYDLMGTPFIGNTQSAVFYPLNILYVLLPTTTAWSLGFVLRTALVGLLTALFARSIGASFAGSTTAGIAFAFCAFTTVWQSQSLGDAALWLPLILLAIGRLWIIMSPASIGLLGIALALPVLAGHPETAMHVSLTGAAYAAYVAGAFPVAKGNLHPRVKFVALFALAGILAVGLSAVQLLPTIEWLGQINRPLDVRWGARPLRAIIAFLSRDLSMNPNSVGIAVPEGAAYTGMLTLILAPFALLGRGKRNALFFIALSLASVGVVYGLEPFYGISRSLPVLAGAKNYRLIGIASFGLAVLAGLGLTAIEKRLSNRAETAGSVAGSVWWLIVCGSLLFGLLSLAAVRVVGLSDGHRFDLALRGPVSSAVVLGASLATIGWGLIARPDRRSFGLVTTTILCADLLGASYGYIPFASPDAVFPEPRVFTYLRERQLNEGQYRILPLDAVVHDNYQMMYGLYSATGYDNPLRTTERLLAPLGYVAAASPASARKVADLGDRRLDMMNVKYLLALAGDSSAALLDRQPERFRLAFADGAVRVYDNLSALPRAFLVPVQAVEVLPTDEQQLARLGQSSFDPAKTVILPELPGPTDGDQSSDEKENGRQHAGNGSAIVGVEQGTNSVRVIAEVAEPAILVLSQAYYPGWRVTVNDQPRALVRANYGLTGVRLGVGHQDVRFSYEPLSLWLGIRISVIALASTIVLFGVRAGLARWRRRRG